MKSPHSGDGSSISIATNNPTFSASVKSSIYPDIKFKLDIQVLQNGVMRVRMGKIDGLQKHYNEAANWAFIAESRLK